jgi:adenine deaminase
MDSTLTRTLIDVAMGRKSADIAIRHGTWVCVQSGELIPDTFVAIKNGRIAYVGPDAARTITKDTVVIDAENKYLVPGLLDAHMHVESGMLTITEFVRAVLPHGTTGMFIDPHEIANVFGLKGVKLMVEEALHQPIHVHVEVPSWRDHAERCGRSAQVGRHHRPGRSDELSGRGGWRREDAGGNVRRPPRREDHRWTLCLAGPRSCVPCVRGGRRRR